jgi:hypothetical protein
VALGHHCFQWLHVTASMAPASCKTVWCSSKGLSKPFFERLSAEFAREVGAGERCRAVVLLDNTGWHTQPNLTVPDCSRPRRCGGFSIRRCSTGPQPT